jgi:hypothetical protein
MRPRAGCQFGTQSGSTCHLALQCLLWLRRGHRMFVQATRGGGGLGFAKLDQEPQADGGHARKYQEARRFTPP